MCKCQKSKFAIILSLILSCSILFNTVVFAKNESAIPADVTASALDYMMNDSKIGELTNPIELYNFNNELECISFQISTGGFITVNVKNKHVIDYCPEGTSEIHALSQQRGVTRKFYTNGALCNYYEVSDDSVAEITTNDIYNKADFSDIYNETAVQYTNVFKRRDYVGEKYTLANSTQAWANGSGSTHYMCVPIASGILLEYYQRVVAPGTGDRYLPAFAVSSPTRVNVVGFLVQNLDAGYPYLPNAGVPLYDAVYGDLTPEATQKCAGLNRYLSWHCSTSRRFDWNVYNWADMEAVLKSNEPFIQHIDPGTNMPIAAGDAHAVVAVGFRRVTQNQRMLIINDGWGNTKREVEIRSGTMPYWIHIA